MTVDDAKIQLGFRYDADLARFLKLTPQSVNNFRRGGSIPDGHVAKIKLEALERKVAAGLAMSA